MRLELFQAKDFSSTAPQKKFTEEPLLMPTSPAARASRQRLRAMEENRSCQRKLGELCRRAPAPRPDICARLAWLGAKVNSLQVRDTYRINFSIKKFEGWQQGAAVK